MQKCAMTRSIEMRVVLFLFLSLGTVLPAKSEPARQIAAGAPSAEENQSAQLRPEIGDPKKAANALDAIVNRAEETEGALFVKEDKITVNAPILSALIELHSNMSPYEIDAHGARSISLKDALEEALTNNQTIKISNADLQDSKWNFRSSLGNFLPDLSNQVNYQTISGRYASPFGLSSPVGSPYLVIPSLINWTFFKGGANFYGAWQARHLYNAAKYGLERATKDILLEVAHLYYQLVLQDVLLQVRIKAVQTSEALVLKNQIQYQYGANTELDLLQAKTQLANDRQALISQQVARRKAAVALATSLNLDSGEDLSASDRSIAKIRLVDDGMKITHLVQEAIDNRPELKKWEQERLAAKAAIRVAFAPLMPQVIGSGGMATTGARIGPSSSNAAEASSAGLTPFGLSSFSTSTVASQGVTTGGRKFGLAEIYLIGISVQWNLGGLGYTEAAKVQAARWDARKAGYEFARELTFVCRQVRDAYLDSIEAENLISATTDAVNSSRQQLTVAVIRLEEGVGTDLDVVHAQQSYTEALISKANAIVKFNESQISLLRAIGRISVDTVTATKAWKD